MNAPTDNLAPWALKVIEIYDHYDGPRLFTAQAASGRLFVVMWLDDSQGRSEWLYLPVSQTRLNELANRSIDLRSAFLSPEGDEVLIVRVDPAQTVTQNTIPANNLDTDWLPYAGEFLDGSEHDGGPAIRTSKSRTSQVEDAL